MKIQFSPMRRDDRLELHRSGDVLTINGEAFDFGPLADGATLPRAAVTCDWLVSDVERIDGDIHLTLILPHGSCAPDQTLFPHMQVIAGDGPVALPVPDEEQST